MCILTIAIIKKRERHTSHPLHPNTHNLFLSSVFLSLILTHINPQLTNTPTHPQHRHTRARARAHGRMFDASDRLIIATTGFLEI
jgi:hypothetical protein